MFLLDAFRANPRHARSTNAPTEPLIPTLKTPDPNNTIVLLEGAELLVSGDSWSRDGIRALCAMIQSGTTGNITVITQIPMMPGSLASLAHSAYWYASSMLIGKVTVLESLTKQTVVYNGKGPCDITVVTTSYLDSICQEFECHNPRAVPNCYHLAYRQIVMGITNFPVTSALAEDVAFGRALPADCGVVLINKSLEYIIAR